MKSKVCSSTVNCNHALTRSAEAKPAFEQLATPATTDCDNCTTNYVPCYVHFTKQIVFKVLLTHILFDEYPTK